MKKTVAICALLVALGGAYGFLSAMRNQNPYYSPSGDPLVPQDQMGKAWGWQPSLVWLPSYVLCVGRPNGFVISHTRSGYLFRSEDKRKTYIRTSTLLGVGIGCLVSVAAVLLQRTRRRSNQQIQAIAAKRGSA